MLNQQIKSDSCSPLVSRSQPLSWTGLSFVALETRRVQMGIEYVEFASTNGGICYTTSAISRYALGARGLALRFNAGTRKTAVEYE